MLAQDLTLWNRQLLAACTISHRLILRHVLWILGHGVAESLFARLDSVESCTSPQLQILRPTSNSPPGAHQTLLKVFFLVLRKDWGLTLRSERFTFWVVFLERVDPRMRPNRLLVWVNWLFSECLSFHLLFLVPILSFVEVLLQVSGVDVYDMSFPLRSLLRNTEILLKIIFELLSLRCLLLFDLLVKGFGFHQAQVVGVDGVICWSVDVVLIHKIHVMSCVEFFGLLRWKLRVRITWSIRINGTLILEESAPFINYLL